MGVGVVDDLQGTPGWPLAPGTTLGKYRIVRFLGEGGMGAVYEGLHLEMGKRVAIKTISPALAVIPEARARFVLEAQLTSRVRHPHTVDITDICMDSGQAYLVMEYLEGEDLARHLRQCGALPVDEVVDIALPIVAAVAAAHDEGIVHRDLKPQNIFLAEMPGGVIHPKVLDFGISKAPAHSTIQTSGIVLGSPSYFAPEQVSDPRGISPASDQYALGVILYECVTGRLPYEGTNLAEIFQAIVSGSYPPPSALRRDLPAGLEQIIARAMRLAPGDRYPDVREMGRALLAFASPKTRLLWHDQLMAPAAANATTRTPEGLSPVPVTDQTPGPAYVSLSETMSILDPRPPERREPTPNPGWIPPTRSSPSGSPGDEIVVPRRFRAVRWAVGAGALVAVAALIGGFGLHGRDRKPAPPVPSAAPTSTSAAPAATEEAAGALFTPAHPADNRAISQPPTGPSEPVTQPEPVPADDGIERRARGHSAHRPRFGPNQAPLIE